MDILNAYIAKLDDYLRDTEDNTNNYLIQLLAKIESLTNIKRSHQAIALQVAFVFYMVTGRFAQLICNALGFVYPMILSLEALDMDAGAERDERITRLLTYWVVFASLSVAEIFTGFLFMIIPFYWLTKMAFLVWCLAPNEYNGSDLIYHRFIRPIFIANRERVDQMVVDVVAWFNRTAQEIKNK